MATFEYIDSIVNTMNSIEKFKDFSGEEKKAYVLRKIQEQNPQEYAKYEDLLPILIDFIVTISKNKNILELNKKAVKFCFPCIFS